MEQHFSGWEFMSVHTAKNKSHHSSPVHFLESGAPSLFAVMRQNQIPCVVSGGFHHGSTVFYNLVLCIVCHLAMFHSFLDNLNMLKIDYDSLNNACHTLSLKLTAQKQGQLCSGMEVQVSHFNKQILTLKRGEAFFDSHTFL